MRISQVVLPLLFIFCFRILPSTAQDTNESDQPLAPIDAAATMRVPDGFTVTMFAGEPDVQQPIGFCIDDRARLWVAEAYNYPQHGTKSGDRIVILEDSDGDGTHDKRTVFYDKLNYVSGIEVGFGGAWVMSPPFMYFIPDHDGDDVPDAEPTLLLDGFGNHANAHNMANGFAWGPDGWLYATHGRSNWSMAGKPGTPENERLRLDGGVWRYHPTRHVYEIFCDGTTNPWGVDWNDYGHAFICNCVNPHLFQVIQGAHYEPWRGRKSSEYAYRRIDTIADHLHFVGLGNVRNGLGSTAEDDAGGGHAHCGTMIYLGDSFPSSYRNQLFTNNIHGRRINNDLLRRKGSGYTASHGPDLMRSKDPWFMGVTLAYGPGGEVYVSDWSDTGECHSTRNTRKETGRIYRLTYGNRKFERVDLSKLSDDELIELQWHENDWFVRHARRLLQERSATFDLSDRAGELFRMFDAEEPIPKKLRALWCLRAIDQADDVMLSGLLKHEDENLRSWAVTLLCEDPVISSDERSLLVELAAEDESPLVRLSLASALQRLAPTDRWPIAEQLVRHAEDRDDQNLPLMYWYAIEPLIDDDLQRYVDLIGKVEIPLIQAHIARRIASSDQSAIGLEKVSSWIANSDSEVDIQNVLDGLLTGLEGRRKVPVPESWPDTFERYYKSENLSLRGKIVRIALIFNDPFAIESLKSVISNPDESAAARNQAIQSLVASHERTLPPILVTAISDEVTRKEAIRGLATFNHDDTADSILEIYSKLTPEEKQIAHATLASRRATAAKLLDAIENSLIDASDVTAFTARQIRSLGDNKISARLSELWGEFRDTPRARARQIETFRKWLSPEIINQADLENGKALFTKQCGTCHQFFGAGGKVGPDISGAQRNNIDYMLENIVDPSASVSNDYRMQIIHTYGGRVINGLIETQNEKTVAILTATERIVLPIGEIESQETAPESIMPDGLLDNLSEQDIRDLFGYLQSQ